MNKIFFNRIIALVICLGLFSVNVSVFAQGNQTSQVLEQKTRKINTITSAVPFLMIAPDARAGAMGDAGVASTPDANSIHWNPAKLSFIENDMGVSVCYSPWLKALVDDISLAYLSGYKKIGKGQTIAGSLMYFSLGEIVFTSTQGDETARVTPNELSLDVSYSRLLSDNFSGGVSARYIYSNLTMGHALSGGIQTHPGNSIAADVSGFYHKDVSLNGQDALFAFGFNISNIGNKISYTENTERDFIPINLRFGTSLTVDLDEYNTFSVLFDVNKLLVPTTPEYSSDSLDFNGDPLILSGYSPDVSVAKGMFQSFYDAPGGFGEELREYTLSLGMEYWYDKQFALRAGYFHEDATKGNRKYFTLGAGLKYNVLGIDFAYLIPMEQRNPLENTLRFSLTFDFEAIANQNEAVPVN